MRNYSGNKKWIPGVVISTYGPLSYTIDADGQEHRRHVDKLKKRVRRDSNSDGTGDEFMQISSEQMQNVLEPESDTQSDSEEQIPNSIADNQSQAPGRGTQQNSKWYRLRANWNAPDRFGH